LQIFDILKKGQQPRPSPDATTTDIKKPKIASDDFNFVVEIRSREQAANSKTQLRTIFYKSTDPFAQANAVLGLIQWFDPSDDSFSDMIDWCDRGISILQRLGDKGYEAYFHAQKGYFLSSMYAMDDVQTYFSIRAAQVTGIQTVTEAQREIVVSRLRKLENEFTTAISYALKLLKDIGNLELWGEILLSIGNAAAERALRFLVVGLHEQAKNEKNSALRALLAAKEAFAKSGNELSVGYAIYNMANHLRFLGEPEEALTLVNAAAQIAIQHNDFRLKQGARLLKANIETGKIPDYVHGERSERKK
jgi:tetratricopeptide (TPR) repeat protein